MTSSPLLYTFLDPNSSNWRGPTMVICLQDTARVRIWMKTRSKSNKGLNEPWTCVSNSKSQDRVSMSIKICSNCVRQNRSWSNKSKLWDDDNSQQEVKVNAHHDGVVDKCNKVQLTFYNPHIKIFVKLDPVTMHEVNQSWSKVEAEQIC